METLLNVCGPLCLTFCSLSCDQQLHLLVSSLTNKNKKLTIILSKIGYVSVFPWEARAPKDLGKNKNIEIILCMDLTN